MSYEPNRLAAAAIAAVFVASTPLLHGGGSGLNTAVIINQNSTNSCAIGNYFCERRQVPPENVLYIAWPGSNISWTSNDFQTVLLTPLLNMLAARHLTNQIDYVVLSMDIPYQTVNATTNGSTVNSTTSALFYGVKDATGNGIYSLANSYAGGEQIFRQAPPATAPGYAFLTTMLTGDSVAEVEHMIDQGVASDGTFPTQPVVLAKSSDPVRNIRFTGFDDAIFNARLCGGYSIQRTNLDSPVGLTNLLGFETGLAYFSTSPGTFVPGAIADSLTSFGGLILGQGGQTTLMAFIAAGAAGSYGTVTEPSADPNKFPVPMVYFYQARGFSLAECYYQSIYDPFEGLTVAEPLAAPFQRTGSGAWTGIASNAVLTGTAPLSLQFTAADRDHPLQQLDLFVDGKYAQTLTNLPPLPGNVLTLTLNAQSLNYTVPANSTIASIANGLGALVQASSNTVSSNLLIKVSGDRLELHSAATNVPAPPSNLHAPGVPSSGSPPAPLVTNAAGTAASLDTFLYARRNQFMNSPAAGTKSCLISGFLSVGSWVQLNVVKTNGVLVSVTVTNQSSTAALLDLATQLTNALGSSAALQGPDGLLAEDLAQGYSGAAFTLRARSPGLAAGRIAVMLINSAGLAVNPAVQVSLNDNLSDLQPRNHVYVRAGATNLVLTFPLNTTTLADGYHELTAVAYEGSHVRTQTRATLPVFVQNTSLSAAMTLLDLSDPSPVQGTYHIQVTANTNNVTAISLFTTGGLLATVPNQSTATFTINGPSLGVGLHPFYALVQTSAGLQYRTQPQSVHLQ
jgi:uncharacterized protein (TIGR03790 family)